jgi:DNA-directed RNA polymerase subunit RPC12/RpoP
MEPPSTSSDRPNSDAGEMSCPWCGSKRVERLGAFGPQLMSAQYMCLSCHSPFERIRQRDDDDDPRRDD